MALPFIYDAPPTSSNSSSGNTGQAEGNKGGASNMDWDALGDVITGGLSGAAEIIGAINGRPTVNNYYTDPNNSNATSSDKTNTNGNTLLWILGGMAGLGLLILVIALWRKSKSS